MPKVLLGWLQSKLAPKLARTAAAGLLGITLACGGLGCGNGESVVTPIEPEVEAVTERYDGDSIYFEIGDSIYEGYVVEGVSADEVLVLLDDRSDMVISVDRIGGTLLADHPDLETRVLMAGEQEGESTLGGEIVAVYSDGVRKIRLSAADFVGGGSAGLDTPRIRFVHEDIDFADGGYLTPEELRKWIRGNLD